MQGGMYSAVGAGGAITGRGAHLLIIDDGSKQQNYLQLKVGPAFNVSTANGVATAYITRLDELKMGEILFTDIKASLNPGLPDDEILLGMNVLKRLELVQRGDSLIIRQYH